MRIIIYNINSFGGTYDYAKYIFKAFTDNLSIRCCTLLMPANASINEANVLKVLLGDILKSDNKWFKRFYYLFRSFVNPFRLFMYLLKQPPSVVLLNDFDQHTALFWAPFFRLLKRKHTFGVYLHDPDRDAFFSLRFLSNITMKSVMSIMDVAFYHGYLPERNYYKGNFVKVKVPFGIYNDTEVDQGLVVTLNKLANNCPLLGILGNIRDEKNYELVIDALSSIEGVKLLIAGQPANSGISVEYYKTYAESKNVANRIIWMTEYMPITAFNAAIQACDIVLLCYKPTFASQSGLLNSIAPFKKKIIVTETKSSLRESVEEFCLGEVIPHNNPAALVLAIHKLLNVVDQNQDYGWRGYIEACSWERHVDIAVDSFKCI